MLNTAQAVESTKPDQALIYTVLLHCLGALSWCTVLVHCLGALSWCTVLVHCLGALSWCTVLVHCLGTQSWHTVLACAVRRHKIMSDENSKRRNLPAIVESTGVVS